MSNKQLAVFEDELKKLAQASVQAERSSAGTAFLSTKGGVLTYREQPIAGNALEVVVLASPVERLFYATRYDPTKIVGPSCFALGSTSSGLKPNPSATEPQSEFCETCPKNQWGSATNGGRGKACSEKRRLLIMTADSAVSPDAINTAEVAALRIPVTSVKGYATYLQTVATATSRPLAGVITKIALVPDPKTQFRLNFSFVKVIDDLDIVKALIMRGERESLNAIASAGFEEDDAPQTDAVKSTKF